MFTIYFIMAYLIGSISFAIIVSNYFKLQDPRSYGSQNAGATNVMRSGNKKAALFTLIGDCLKGTLVVYLVALIAKRYYHHEIAEYIIAMSGFFVIVGHIYPIFFKFKGGKGVATALGVILGFNPLCALLALVSWFIVFKLSKISSLAAIVTIMITPVYAYIIMGNDVYFGVILLISTLVLYQHKSNIVKLINKSEYKFNKH